jgi:exosome complex RNA-binding protein Rrp42 (RNase PH superfamily)
MRIDNRQPAQMRPVEIVTGCLMTAEGSALI